MAETEETFEVVAQVAPGAEAIFEEIEKRWKETITWIKHPLIPSQIFLYEREAKGAIFYMVFATTFDLPALVFYEQELAKFQRYDPPIHFYVIRNDLGTDIYNLGVFKQIRDRRKDEPLGPFLFISDCEGLIAYRPIEWQMEELLC